MNINRKGLEIVKHFEGLKLEAYLCPAGVWTIGYGHTGDDVVKGRRISQAQAEVILRGDLKRFEQAVARLVKVPLNSNQFSALVSFAFNVGAGALENSTLLRKLNERDYPGAAAEFDRWNKAAGKVLPGLVARRNAEQALFQEAI